jgi:ABC-type multidrug transport system ATPase subunit
MDSVIDHASDMLPRPAVLHALDLSFGHTGLVLFEELSFTLPAGLSLVRGGDGRGKTTLLRLLSGEIRPRAGRIEVNGVELDRDPAGYRRQVHLTGAGAQAFEQVTPVEALAAVRAQWPDFDLDLLDALVEGLSLQEHMGKKLFMLSTGSRRKLWLAAALASRAPVTLVDDPFGALDRPSIAFVREMLRAAAGDPGRALVFSGWETPPDLPLATVVDLGD